MVCPFHQRCKKYRSCLLSHRFGQAEVVSYLGAWLGAAQQFASADAHIRFAPNPVAVEAYAARN
eukprot:10179904-Alexandrium_andersonii.AAC.1